MKTIYKLLLAVVALLPLAGCSKDNPFPNGENEATGALNAKALTVELLNKENVLNKVGLTRADVSVGDFTVSFVRDGDDAPIVTYKYSEMPEIVTLPVGKYFAVATYGDNPDAQFDAPYFMGETEFEIRENEITDNIDTIVCKFSNVRVTIILDPVLQAHMDATSKVTVRMGDNGVLDFNAGETRSGYFAYVADSHTLTAEFDGLIDDVPYSEVKTYTDVVPGNHYRLTFRLKVLEPEDKGDVNGSFDIDVEIERDDINVNVDSGWESVEDDRNDNNPDIPDNPGGSGPVVVPADGCNLNLDAVNEVGDGDKVALKITSASGFNQFEIHVDDEALQELLAPMLGRNYFDLIDPQGGLDACQGLGLLAENETTVRGLREKIIDVSAFVSMLPEQGKTYTFTIVVGDADASVTKNLKIVVK